MFLACAEYSVHFSNRKILLIGWRKSTDYCEYWCEYFYRSWIMTIFTPGRWLIPSKFYMLFIGPTGTYIPSCNLLANIVYIYGNSYQILWCNKMATLWSPAPWRVSLPDKKGRSHFLPVWNPYPSLMKNDYLKNSYSVSASNFYSF